MVNDLKKIKKLFGEDMMRYCRGNFSTILETNGILTKILMDKFYSYNGLLSDIKNDKKEIDFLNFINKCFENEVTYNKKNTSDLEIDPYVLMSDAGYNLYKCVTEEDILKFENYYEEDELLCTFNNIRDRLNNYDVFFAVKKNVNKIKRSSEPKRQDEYGTSVISLQVSKSNSSYLSIKNRYNHTVDNPDATFSNNLDNIIDGLTDSFINHFNYKFNNKTEDFDLKNYVRAQDGKYYKYNHEVNTVYYCIDNIIIKHGEALQFEKEKYILMDHILVSLIDNTVSDLTLYYMNFHVLFENIDKIAVLNKFNESGDKIKEIVIEQEQSELSSVFIINKDNQIISATLPNINSVDDNFLRHCKKVEFLNMKNLITVGDNFLSTCENLIDCELPSVEVIGDNFCCKSINVKKIEFNNIKTIGNCFMYQNKNMEVLFLSNLRSIGNKFLCNNVKMRFLSLPNVETIGDNFFADSALEYVSLPNLTVAGKYFCSNNTKLSYLNLDLLEIIGDCALYLNKKIEKLSLPNIVSIGNDFLRENEILKEFYIPKIEGIGHNFLKNNKVLSSLEFLNLVNTGDEFMSNSNLEFLNCPVLETVGCMFMAEAKKIKFVDVKNLKSTGKDFFTDCESLESINLDSLKELKNNSLCYTDALKCVSIPNVEYLGLLVFFESNLEKIYMPKVNKINLFSFQNHSLNEICINDVNVLPENLREFVNFDHIKNDGEDIKIR